MCYISISSMSDVEDGPMTSEVHTDGCVSGATAVEVGGGIVAVGGASN